MSARVRPPAVAGLFYPADARELRSTVAAHLAAASVRPLRPKALIVPHAGYIYSGPIAASGYRLLEPLRDTVTRVVLLGPSHRVGFHGIATPGVTAYATPLGEVALDLEALAAIAGLPGVIPLDRAHVPEHSLEVHLPFLQSVLDAFRLVPLVVGEASPAEVDGVLEALWGGDETLIVVSSDLSHYLDYRSAQASDSATSQAIAALDPRLIGPEQACGCRPVAGLLWAARRHGLHCEVLDLRNSGDTAGSRHQVVGYGAYAFVA